MVAVVSGLFESFVGDSHLYTRMMCTSPVRFPGIPNLTGTPLREAELYQVLYSCPRQLPLLPDVHPNAAVQPFIPALHRYPHTRYVEVVKPSADEHLYLVHYHSDVSALTALKSDLTASIPSLGTDCLLGFIGYGLSPYCIVTPSGAPMASADFSQFVVTAVFFISRL